MALSGVGGTALIGATGRSPGGAAFVFHRDTEGVWRQTKVLRGSDGDGYDRFGQSVALSRTGTIALAGAPSAHFDSSGEAYAFEEIDGSWSDSENIVGGDSENLDSFGWSVSLSRIGRKALVGAYGHDGGLGAAYVFVALG